MYERHKRRFAGRAAALGTEVHCLCPQLSDLSVNLFKFTGSEKRGGHGDYHTAQLSRDGIISLIRCKRCAVALAELSSPLTPETSDHGSSWIKN